MNYSDQIVLIYYTNYKDERSIRPIQPTCLSFEENNIYHGKNQWILTAWDFTKDDTRYFAMKDIEGWLPVETYLEPGDRISFRGWFPGKGTASGQCSIENRLGTFVTYGFPLGTVRFNLDGDDRIHYSDITEITKV